MEDIDAMIAQVTKDHPELAVLLQTAKQHDERLAALKGQSEEIRQMQAANDERQKVTDEAVAEIKRHLDVLDAESDCRSDELGADEARDG